MRFFQLANRNWVGVAACVSAYLILISWGFGQEPLNSRLLGVEGVENARDSGGYPAQDGKMVRWGVLYRSNQLGYMTDLGRERFLDLKIRTVVDFRMVSQVDALPDPAVVMETAAYHHFPILIEGGTSEEIYLNIINKCSDSLAQAFILLADPQNYPFLCHCVVGKDRTGVFIALVHQLLGVSRDDSMADYLLSASISSAFYVDANWLNTVFSIVDEEGGIETFLENRGVNRDIQQAIRANLLTPASAVQSWERY